MNQVYCILILTFFSICLSGQTSILFTEEAYLIADEQIYIQSDATNTGTSGSNQVWNFSHLRDMGQLKSYLHPQNQREWALIFPRANMILEENNLIVFIKADKSTLTEYGYITGGRRVVYDQPVVRFPFPFEYGSTINGLYSGTRYANQKRAIAGKYTTEADGLGTLMLPGGRIYDNVVRVRFSKKLDGNLSEEVTYRWYHAKNDPVRRNPLLTIFTQEEEDLIEITGSAYLSDESTISFSEVDKSDVIYNHLNENNPILNQIYEYSVQPNPFSETASIRFSLPKDGNVLIQAFDNTGRLLVTLLNEFRSAGKHEIKFEGSGEFVQHIRLIVEGQFTASKKVFQLIEY